MIRVLFVVLAVVAIVLAIVLAKPLLYLLAIVLLVSAGGMLAAGVRRRHVRELEVVRPPILDPKEELQSLGIVGIRPKGSADNGAGSFSAPEAENGEEEEAAGEPFDRPKTSEPVRPSAREKESGMKPMSIGGNGPLFGSPPPAPPREDADREIATPVGETAVGSVRKKSRTARILVEGVSDTFDAEVMLSVLRGLRAAVDANTVCLLRQEDGALAYSVEAVVSRNAFARNGGRFAVSEPLVAGHRALEPVVLICGSPGGFDPKRLGYYHEPIAIRQAAFVPLAGPQNAVVWLLVADSMGDSGLDRAAARGTLGEFGRLVQSFITRGIPPLTRSTPTGVPLRPRREIIADEMEAARAGGGPLALALVYLNRAEAIGERGPVDVGEADAVLRERLEAAASGGRVERFGELTYGIFRRAQVDETALWASDLQAGMAREGGSLQGGVSVGIAMLGDRHDGPDELRSDATAALRESFETGECVILE